MIIVDICDNWLGAPIISKYPGPKTTPIPCIHKIASKIAAKLLKISAKVRLEDLKNPKVFVAENVKGILSANKGLAIETIIKDFRSLEPGYLVIPKLIDYSLRFVN